MEMICYRCLVCGFVHQVPAYWSSFDADEIVELQHVNLLTGNMCTEEKLHKVQEES